MNRDVLSVLATTLATAMLLSALRKLHHVHPRNSLFVTGRLSLILLIILSVYCFTLLIIAVFCFPNKNYHFYYETQNYVYIMPLSGSRQRSDPTVTAHPRVPRLTACLPVPNGTGALQLGPQVSAGSLLYQTV